MLSKMPNSTATPSEGATIVGKNKVKSGSGKKPKGAEVEIITIHSPQIGHPPDSDKLLAFEDFFCIRKGVWLYDSASVAAITRHFEDLSDLRVSDLKSVNRITAHDWDLLHFLMWIDETT
jgi:hypothetical protein